MSFFAFLATFIQHKPEKSKHCDQILKKIIKDNEAPEKKRGEMTDLDILKYDFVFVFIDFFWNFGPNILPKLTK